MRKMRWSCLKTRVNDYYGSPAGLPIGSDGTVFHPDTQIYAGLDDAPNQLSVRQPARCRCTVHHKAAMLHSSCLFYGVGGVNDSNAAEPVATNPYTFCEHDMEYARIAPIMGRLWSPIAAVTSNWQGKSNAQIAVAIAAASIVPDMPRVLLQIYKNNYSHDLIYNCGSFALNFIRRDQLQLIKDFGLVSGRDTDKLSDVGHVFRETGSPILDDCWGFLDCRVVNAMDGGDMTCFLADVLEGETLTQAEPLYWRDARREIPAEWNEEWDRKITGEIEVSKQRMPNIDLKPWLPTGQES